MTWRGAQEFAAETGEIKRLVRGMIRRMAVTIANGAKWQLLGQRGGTAGDETPTVEAFTGIGFYSRAPSSGKPEAIVAAVGGAKHQVIVATRDEATRQAAAGALVDGETAIYNDKAIIVVKADGTVEIRLLGGVAIRLATKDDLDVLRTAIAGAVISIGLGGAATINALADTTLAGRAPPTGPWPNGTSVLKGQ